METLAQKKSRAGLIIAELNNMYPEVRCELEHANAYQLLVATILSAQCTDKRVNMVTPTLFDRYPMVNDMAQADRDDVIGYIRSTGFFNNKSTNILACCKDIVERFNGEIPGTLEELISLSGVGRKTANVVLNHIFHVPAIVVDTHVGRISRHLGLTREKNPTKVEFALMKILPEETWIPWNHQLIKHGRTVCIARRPHCGQCQLRALCPGPINN